MKNKKYHTVGTSPKFNRKITERGKSCTTNTHTYDRSLSSWLGTRTSIKKRGLGLIFKVLMVKIHAYF